MDGWVDGIDGWMDGWMDWGCVSTSVFGECVGLVAWMYGMDGWAE